MFIGHFAVGLAAKKFEPRINLGVAFIACQLLDLIWPVLVLAGIELVSVDYNATKFTPLNFEYYPVSHSMLMSLIYSLLFGSVVFATLRSKRAAFVAALIVFSHWLLDFFSHRPDLPIAFDGHKVGLGLWNSVPLTLIVEVGLFAAGIYLYLKVSAPTVPRLT